MARINGKFDDVCRYVERYSMIAFSVGGRERLGAYVLRESCSRADDISEKHCLLGGMCDISARCEAACVDCIRLDAGCRC